MSECLEIWKPKSPGSLRACGGMFRDYNKIQISAFDFYISIVKPTRCTISQIYFILEQHSTCFGRSLRPSS
jgi:hypothetical protein